MSQILLFLVLGLGEGALIGAIALAVVLTYRGSGTVNVATGAMAMYTAYLYTDLRVNGAWFVPPLPNPLALVEGIAGWFGANWDLPNWPTSISVGGPMSFWPATLLSLGTAAALGYLFHRWVFRPLSSAPPLAKVIASVGVMLTLEAVVVRRFGGDIGPSVPRVLPTGTTHLFGARVPYDRLVLAGLTLLAATVLWAAFRFTRFGLATRAAAGNEKGALLLGISPSRQAGATWVIGTVLAGTIGILLRGLLPLEPTVLTLAVIPALGAALAGDFTSFGVAALAGLGFGMSRSLVTFMETRTWWPHVSGQPLPGVREALPFVVIVGIMFVRGRSLPVRGSAALARLPFSPTPRGAVPRATVAAAVTAIALCTLSFGWRGAIINSLIGVLLSLSLVLLVGFVGQISLGQMAIAGVAGFAVSKLADGAGIPFPIAPLLAALVAAVFGAAAAVPALRVRGVNLAVVTLAAAVAIEELVFKNDWVEGKGGAGAPVSSPALFGLRFGPNDPFFLGDGKLPSAGFGLALLVIVVLFGLAVSNLRRGTSGLRMLAVRGNERAAAAAGVNVAATKILAFGLSSFIAGLAGAMIGYQYGSLTAPTFDVFTSLTVLAFAYLGGITSVSGAVIGGLLATGGVAFYTTQTVFGVGSEFSLLIGGIGLVLTAVGNPEGIAGALRDTARTADGLLRRHRPAAGPRTRARTRPAGDAVVGGAK
ncbi:ABC transporter permease [Frankia sp. Cr1]|uniref:ABC transporter permease n=1 Tax=Frankia sp. Cr1 TaxID=3073931 RepID=UPI002AD2908D|nr:ABC transporter permease [Frankia sp. Cr1]